MSGDQEPTRAPEDRLATASRAPGERRRPADLGDFLAAHLAHPVRLVPLAFLGAIAVGTGLLCLPAAHAPGRVDVLAAAFTTVSAVCVTGLTTVDTATYWTPLGQVIIMLLIQIGGLGIMTLATLLSLAMRGRLGLRQLDLVRAETSAVSGGDVRDILRRIIAAVAVAELLFAAVLTARFRATYDDNLGAAAWHGLFHSISAFNNAGFALYSDNLVGFVGDAWICWPISLAIIAGGIGYPVFLELLHAWRWPRLWSVHTRVTVGGTAALLVGGTVAYLGFEWTNPGTFGPLSVWEKLVAATTASTVARTAGFNSVDYGQMTSAMIVITIVLMFIGGGSAGTAGGIKVTTFVLLGFVILAEVRGDRDVLVGRRRVDTSTQRQALAVALLAVGAVMAGTVVLVAVTGLPLDKVAFEAVSAFGTVGLSTGITPHLEPAAQLVLMLLMFIGRVGTITVASALALRHRERRYRYPTERAIVG